MDNTKRRNRMIKFEKSNRNFTTPRVPHSQVTLQRDDKHVYKNYIQNILFVL